MAFDPENGYMYVANSVSGTVSVLNTIISTTRFSTTSTSSTSSSTTSISTTSYSSSSTSYSITSSYSPSTKPTFTTSVESPSGHLVNIGVTGNISSNQISSMVLSNDSTDNQLALSFTLTGIQGSQGFATIAIPGSVLPNGFTPLVYIDNALAPDQSYYSDQSNYYVSFAIQSGTHQISIVFSQGSSSKNSTYVSNTVSNSSSLNNASNFQFDSVEAIGALAVAAIGGFVLIKRRRS